MRICDERVFEHPVNVARPYLKRHAKGPTAGVVIRDPKRLEGETQADTGGAEPGEKLYIARTDFGAGTLLEQSAPENENWLL
jgi:hypothetical protein